MIQNRKIYLNVMKFFAIVLVVFGHCMQKYVNNYTNTIIYNFIWLFQMPAFFFVYGYLHVKEEKVTTAKDMWKYVFKRFKAYFIPIVTFILLDSIITKNYSSFNGLLLIIKDRVIQWPFNIQTSLWFLFALMTYSIYSIFVTYVLSKQNSRTKKIIIGIISLCLFEAIFLAFFYFINGAFLGSKLVVYYSIYFVFGYIFERFENNDIFTNFKSKIDLNLILCIVSGIISLCICIFVSDIASFDDNNILQLCIRVLGSIMTVLFVFLLLKILLKSKEKSFVSKLGQYTLEIYYIHVILYNLDIFNGAAPNYYESVFDQWKIAIISFVIMLICSYIINFAIQYIPYLHYAIFGTKENKLNLFKNKEVQQCKN